MTDLIDDILGVFARRDVQALFVTELQSALAPAVDPAALTAALEQLAARGDLVIVVRNAPDPHLEGADLRIVARSGDAAEGVWRSWLREFLASHRCT